jgi:hypothetical protein
MQFIIKGFTAQDIEDFAKSKQWQEIVEEDGEQISNPVSAGQHCKDYFTMLVKNDIKAYRLKVAKQAVAEPAEPDIIVE